MNAETRVRGAKNPSGPMAIREIVSLGCFLRIAVVVVECGHDYIMITAIIFSIYSNVSMAISAHGHFYYAALFVVLAAALVPCGTYAFQRSTLELIQIDFSLFAVTGDAVAPDAQAFERASTGQLHLPAS